MSQNENSRLVYAGKVFRIEFYLDSAGCCPAEDWLADQTDKVQQKFAALFAWMGDRGRIVNEQKFKHLSGSDQIFEFKADQGTFFASQKGPKTPRGEIGRAEAIKKDFLGRAKV